MSNEIMDRHDTDTGLLVRQCEKDFIQLIRTRLGIVIKKHQLNDMYNVISQACRKFNCTPDNYLGILLNCRDDSPYLEYLVAGVTIGETYFFRDSHQMQLLQEIVLPSLIKMKREQKNLTLRIWSEGCATGEEIYTLAIMLSEILPDVDKWTLQLMGTDINTLSLRKAMDGIYSEWSMRSISDFYKQKYFTYDEKKYYLKSSIRSLVKFDYLNLNDDMYPSIFNNTNAQDLILCRNVLIYFDTDHTQKLMKKLDSCLVEGAFILLGASDPISIKNTWLKSFDHEGALLVHSSQINTGLNIQINQVQKPDISSSVLPVLIKPQVNKSTLTQPAKIISDTSPIEQINKLMGEGLWDEAIDLMNKSYAANIDPIFLLNSRASALANLGQLDQAVKVCHESIELDSTNANTYFTEAMILIETNQLKDAESALRKSLFLDHQFVAAHFQLGLLLIRNKQIKDGLKSLGNALTITRSKSPSQNVEGFKGLDYGRLSEILKREMELYMDTKQV